MRSYSYPFSCHVVETFFAAHSRGTRILGRIFANVNVDYVVELFQFHQQRWNVFKKLVKLCERLSLNPKFDFAFIKARCLTSVKYFHDWERGSTWTQRHGHGTRA